MVNLSPSFFTRLYGSIILAVIVSIALTQYFVDNLFEQDALNDFVRDTDYIYRDIEKQIINNPSIKYQKLVTQLPFADEFNMQWQAITEESTLCFQCEYLANVGEIEVYQLADEALLAVYLFEQLQANLLISDKVYSPFIEENNKQERDEFSGLNVEEIAFYLFTLIVLLVIAGTIYWPIRKLQKQINALVAINQRFGTGELQVRTQETLPEPLNELALSFNNMANSIESTVKENQIFAQAVPHEVRTPLSRIQLAAGLLRKNNTNIQQLALLENVDSYIDDIDELIGQVVTFSRLNSSVDDEKCDQYQSITFLSFIKSRIATQTIAPSIKLELLIDESLEITTNPAYLRLLIDNLFKNALGHTVSKVTISIMQVSGNVELAIEDDGNGIPEARFETVFLPFARLDKSRSRKTGGLGLGLAIARAASKRMHGELTVENNEVGGARFNCKFSVNNKN